ncbi:MAG: FHA domain-containing protein [Pseudomonadota bacterium]|nr:FHA domain-containing protein [Pseudomonadota bacterium]
MERGHALLGTQGLLAGQRFAITPEGLRIGREVGNEVHIDDAGVSRQHARVLLHNGSVWVQDAGSRNGIFVNGERVPDHKQMKLGDQLSVGAHVFEVVASGSAASPRPSASVAPPPAPRPAARPQPAASRWKIWPFVVVIFVVASFIACIGFLGGSDEPASAATAGPKSAYSLTTLLEPTASGPAAGGPAMAPAVAAAAAAPGTPSVAQALAVVAGADPSGSLANIPDAPPGTGSRELLELAQGMYDSGRLADAKKHYQMALKLDATCEICSVRIGRIDTELAAKVQQQFDAGMRYFDSMQFSQAVASWETVLMLVPDPADPMNVRATEYLQRAKEAAGGR